MKELVETDIFIRKSSWNTQLKVKFFTRLIKLKHKCY